MVRLFNRRRRRMPPRNAKGRFVKRGAARRRRNAPRRRRKASSRRRPRNARGQFKRRANPGRRKRPKRSRRYTISVRARPKSSIRKRKTTVGRRRAIARAVLKRGGRGTFREKGAIYANPRRRRRRRRVRRRNPYLVALNPRRRRRRVRRRRAAPRRRSYRRRRNPGFGSIVGRLKAMVSAPNLIDAGWSIAGMGAALALPRQLLGLANMEQYSDGLPGLVASGVVGAAASVAADRFLGRKAGDAVFRGVLIAEVAQLLFALVPSVASQLLPTWGGMGYLPYGYGNDALLASEAGASGMGSWLSLSGMGQLPASSIAGMGDWVETRGPAAAVGPMAAPPNEVF